ncbi:SDR family NAD(P)-dependent oxidoreductase [Legionella longbeachae]|uniref:Putative short-chain dehydrogenases/reductases family protein n=1 Tax=Legionella longbeachae serogroup 1 (strain NSW150) TaxID=661367 RepID=D3HSZ2_LEGLN|nr:SDR family oxidoreductase [Legionella longbeachae]VEE02523.1 short-chain dehydrogenases/reductases family protein [Legionella oakridgensis]HBD7398783.1 SDR family oxidoreductase [Legionella pneumophila]ARB91205.1 SDR family NAD(P)-dependent oxidoreductase [Legionella longbeachae]ARM32370.1 SDR family oxidoreductase [Legionella longbeachae]QIN32370.1 glucose 1-dehydrogenase [Legionella longbeachae]
MDFKKKKVIVTGANRSIGQRIAIAFAEQGADVVISYHSDSAGAEKTLKAITKTGARARAFYADFSDMNQVPIFAEHALGYLGYVDILVNNAGISSRETIFELLPEKMQQVFQINCISPFYLTQLCAKNMMDRENKGCIINISSISGTITMPKGIGYGASKAALNKWTKHAALDLAKYGIRVNTIAPGVIEAGMNEDTATNNPELWSYLLSNIPLQTPGTPNDIAHMALFIASEKASWITGKVFMVDGGHVL